MLHSNLVQVDSTGHGSWEHGAWHGLHYPCGKRREVCSSDISVEGTLGDQADDIDVRITYTPLEGEGDAKFDSEVSSHKRSAGPESKPSTGTSCLLLSHREH